MTNNDILRQLRYALDLDDAEMLATFAAGGCDATSAQLAGWLARDDAPGYVELPDGAFAACLDGLVTRRRGPPPTPAGAAPALLPMTNNRVLRAVRIALKLEDRDVIAILARAGLRVSRSELGALFRRADHKNYRECGDQFLRNFLRGLALERRG